MRRQKPRRMQLHDDEHDFQTHFAAADALQMQHVARQTVSQRFDNILEAKVCEGDTLQSMALRFHCTVADIKRLNKIDKDNEIYARKVLKIPLTVHSVLLGTAALPEVHKSGNNSPNHAANAANSEQAIDEHIMRNPLEDARVMLGEKLLVASVNATNINEIVLNNSAHSYTDVDATELSNDNRDSATAALLDDEYLPRMQTIRGPSLRTLDWSGSDCDMSWVCLFIVILAACFVIPLVYVIYLAEHVHHHNTTAH